MGQGGNYTQRIDIIDSIDPRIVMRGAQKGTLYRYIPAVGDPILLIKLDDGCTLNWGCVSCEAEACTNVVAASSDICPPPEDAPDLGVAAPFLILGASTVTNTGPSVVNGDLGLSPGVALVGFPPGIVTGETHVTDAEAAAAQVDANAAYLDLEGRAPGIAINPAGGGLDALVLAPGTYTSGSTMDLSVGATLTLDALGDPNAVWIFQLGSALTLNNGSMVSVINGGSAANVFWQVGSSATIGTTAVAVGTIIALASVTMQTGASLEGRAWALTAAVTLDTNNVFLDAVTGCGDVDLASAPATLDGVTLVIGDLILLKNQEEPAENGVYIFNGEGEPLVRSDGWNEADEFTVGRQVCVAGGDENTGTTWQNDNVVIELEVTPISFSEVTTGDFMLRDYSNAQAPVRIATNPDTLVVGTDRSLMVDTSVGAVPFVVNMPAGVNGQEFWVKDIGANATANNITFVPDGVETMEAGADITNDSSSRHFQFFSNVWYIMDLP